MRTIAATGGFAALCWGVFFLLFHRDRSRYRNCYALFLALVSLYPLSVNLAGPFGGAVALAIVWVILAAILIVPFFLIYNGIVMIPPVPAAFPGAGPDHPGRGGGRIRGDRPLQLFGRAAAADPPRLPARPFGGVQRVGDLPFLFLPAFYALHAVSPGHSPQKGL